MGNDPLYASKFQGLSSSRHPWLVKFVKQEYQDRYIPMRSKKAKEVVATSRAGSSSSGRTYSDELKWKTPPGHTDVFNEEAKRIFIAHLNATVFDTSCPLTGRSLNRNCDWLARRRMFKLSHSIQNGTILNCCRLNCGPDTIFGGYPVQFGKDATKSPKSSLGHLGHELGYRLPACKLPHNTLPGVHAVRIVGCNYEHFGVGVICGLLKVTAGEDPLVQGLSEIKYDMRVMTLEADHTKHLNARLAESCGGDKMGKRHGKVVSWRELDICRAVAMVEKFNTQFDPTIRRAIAEVRFSAALEQLSKSNI